MRPDFHSHVRDGGASKSINLLFTFGLFLVTWLPYMIAFFPGSPAGFDTVGQISQYFGYSAFSSHHPILSSISYGLVAQFGLFIGGLLGIGDNGLGLAVMLFQTLCFAAAFVYLLYVCRDYLSAPRWFLVAILCFFCILPVWGHSFNGR